MMHSLPVEHAQLGMFVADLDRPWVGTPFLMQGFLLDEAIQLAQLRAACKTIVIDLSRSHPDVIRGLLMPSVALRDTQSSKLPPLQRMTVAISQPSGVAPEPKNEAVKYAANQPLRKTIAQARTSVDDAVRALDKLSVHFVQGRQLDPTGLDDAADAMVLSCTESADALLWVARLRTEVNATYKHCLIVAACMLAVGRHMGFAQEELKRLCLIGLLLDVGMLKVPQTILQQPGQLSSVDMAHVRQHVDYAVELMQPAQMDLRVVQGVAQHHERLDGSGYPQGLRADEIGFHGRLAAIADVFAAITSERTYAAPQTPFAATRELFSLAKDRLHEPLVETFVQAVGIFPVGTLVELTTQEVAIVVRHNQTRRLQPKVLVVMTADKVVYPMPYELDLLTRDQDEQGNKLNIVRGLPSNAYGIDTAAYFVRPEILPVV